MEHTTKGVDLIAPVSPSLLQAYLSFWPLKLRRDVLVGMAFNTKTHPLCSVVKTWANWVHFCFISLETPSKPRSASVYLVNESIAILTWLVPEITGTPTNVLYDVNCRPSCDSFSGCENKTCNSDVNGQLTGEGLKTTIFTAANLASFVNYTCKITAKNRVSKIAAAKTQASESERSVTYVTLRTKGSGKFIQPDIKMGSSLIPLHFMGTLIKRKE